MNRREFLGGIGASVAALAVPAVKAKREPILDVMERDLSWSHKQILYWQPETHKAEQLSADLAVQVAYWQEQYEQAKVALDHYRVSYQLWHNRACDLQAELTPDRPDPLDHFYQGDCHTEGEWRAHLLEQDRNA